MMDRIVFSCPKCLVRKSTLRGNAKLKMQCECGHSFIIKYGIDIKYGASADQNTYDKRIVSKRMASLLAILFGHIGIHRFYLGAWGCGLVYLLLNFIGIPLMLIGIREYNNPVYVNAFIVFICFVYIILFAEAIMFWSMDDVKFNRQYNDGPVLLFKW